MRVSESGVGGPRATSRSVQLLSRFSVETLNSWPLGAQPSVSLTLGAAPDRRTCWSTENKKKVAILFIRIASLAGLFLWEPSCHGNTARLFELETSSSAPSFRPSSILPSVSAGLVPAFGFPGPAASSTSCLTLTGRLPSLKKCHTVPRAGGIQGK